MAVADEADSTLAETTAPAATSGVIAARLFGWISVGVMTAFLIDNYLTFWWDWPGARSAASGEVFGVLLAALYAGAILMSAFFVLTSPNRSLRRDAATLHNVNLYIVRAAFWMVLIVGLADMVISFIRVEGWLDNIFGEELAAALGRSAFRGLWVHVPLIGLSLIIAAFTRTLGFIWLALLVVAAELQIVVGRFIFSYEQAFMADLVRFWYAALFLFASAYTLYEDDHVRVDVVYANFTRRTKGVVNSVGALILGMTLCWTILILGTSSGSAAINSPILSFEVTQAGFGLYVKYMMAGFLLVFAVTMLIQFISAYFEGVADRRGHPGGRKMKGEGHH